MTRPAEPLDERGPLLGSTDQVAADLDQATKLGIEHVYWNSDDARTASSRYWNSCVAADRSCGSQTPLHLG